jgi:predicted amidohydrolase YtcJ
MSDHLILGTVSDIGHPGRSASAVWVRNGLVHAVGGDDVASRARRAGAVVVDRSDSYISPGFVDPHAHVEAYAVACRTSVDLRFPAVRSVSEVLARLRTAAATGEGWIIAQANLFWDQKLDECRYPTRAELDGVSTARPIAIRAGGHVSILNTKALALAGIDTFSDRNGMMGRAVIGRDGDGRLTGMIAELDALLPAPDISEDGLRQALLTTLTDDFLRHGVTTVGEIVETRRGAGIIGSLGRGGRLPLRVFQHLWVPGAFDLADIDALVDSGEVSGGLARIAAVKVFADGGFSSRNAAVLTPYTGSGSATESATGDLNLAPEDIHRLLDFCHGRGVQLAVHTNGERAQHMVLDAARSWATDRPGIEGMDALLRLEHAGNLVTSGATTSRLRTVGARAVTQPTFVYTFAGLLPEILGAPACTGRHPYRTLIDAGIEPAASSDIHMGAEPQQMNPFFGMWCAVARRSFRGEAIEPLEAVSVREALAMYTLNAARALGVGHLLGSVTPGKAADLAVCSADPTTTDVDALPELRVTDVWVDGRPATLPSR